MPSNPQVEAEVLSVEEVDWINSLRPSDDDFTADDWQWAISLCGGRDRLYGPDTPVPIGSYVAVVPRQRAERAEAERDQAAQQERERIEAALKSKRAEAEAHAGALSATIALRARHAVETLESVLAALKPEDSNA